MRHRSPLRLTCGRPRNAQTASSLVCLAIATLPSLWVSWQAPVARGVVLPALAILTLVLLLPRARSESERRPGETHSDARALSRLRAHLGRQVSTLTAYPALFYLGWVAVCSVRSARAPVPGAAEFARGELLRVSAGILLYLVLACTARRWSQARQIVDALLWAAVTTTVMAYLNHRADDPALMGPFGNPQLMASVLLLLAPLAIMVGTTARDGRRRILAQVAAVLALSALALTQSRSAWLGGFVSLLALAFLLSRLPRQRRRRWSHRSPSLRPNDGTLVGGPALAAGLLALSALGWLVCHADMTGPISARVTTLARLSDDEGASWRLRQWRATLSLAREHPLVGVGLGAYPLLVASRLPQPIPLAMARSVGPNLSLNAHSFYLQTLTETGAIGLGLYLWTILSFLVAGMRACRRREHPFRSLVVVACLAAVTGQIVDALANPAYQFAEVSLFFWAILGLGTAMAQAPPRLGRVTSDAAGEAEADTGAAVPSYSGAAPRGSTPHTLPPLTYPLRLAAVLTGAGVLTAGTVAGAPPPLNQAEYMPLQTFQVVALTTPGYMLQTLLPGECVEMRGRGTLYSSSEERDATDECTFTRAGGTAPTDSLEQLPAPHANLFCVPTGVPPECDGCTVTIQGTFSFNGQTLSALGPPLCLSVPRAATGTLVTATPRVIPPTDEMVEIRAQYVEGNLHFQRLWKVDANEALAAGDVQIVDDTHVLLRASSTVPGRRIYTLRYRFRDHLNRTWIAPVQVYVR
jgi:O-antigen ligase